MRSTPHDSPSAVSRRLPIRSPQGFAGRMLLLAIAALGFLGSWHLDFGQFGGVGSGMVPQAVSAMIAGFNLLLIVQASFPPMGRG